VKPVSVFARAVAAYICSFSPNRASFCQLPRRSGTSSRIEECRYLRSFGSINWLAEMEQQCESIQCCPAGGKAVNSSLECLQHQEVLQRALKRWCFIVTQHINRCWPNCGHILNPSGATYPCFPRTSADVRTAPNHSSTARRGTSPERTRTSTRSAVCACAPRSFCWVPRCKLSSRALVALLTSDHSGEPASLWCTRDGGERPLSSAVGETAQPIRVFICRSLPGFCFAVTSRFRFRHVNFGSKAGLQSSSRQGDETRAKAYFFEDLSIRINLAN